MSPDLVIREARREDAPFIRDAQLKMAFETEGGLQLDPATVDKGVQAVFDDPAKGAYLMATTADGRPVACLLTAPEWSDWRNGTVLWIHSLWVVPEYRRAGVFRRMYAFLRAKVEASDAYRGLRLFVDKRNEAARRAYEDVGMTAEHYDTFEWLK